MRQTYVFPCLLALALLLTGCTGGMTDGGSVSSALAPEGTAAGSEQASYTGVITERFTEGGGTDQAEVLTLETEDGTVYCALLPDSQGDLSAATGDRVTAVCQVVEGAPDYHPILTLTVLEQAASAAGETAAWETDALSLSVILPEGWDWGLIADDTDDTACCLSIAFWPEDVPELEVTLALCPAGIGMCGTGVTIEDVTLPGGLTATTYTEEIQGATWFTLVYQEVDGLPEGASLVAACTAEAALWGEWKEEVLSILSTVQYQGDFLPWADALERAKFDFAQLYGYTPEDWSGDLDPSTGIWTVTFYEEAEDGGRAAVWSTQVTQVEED